MVGARTLVALCAICLGMTAAAWGAPATETMAVPADPRHIANGWPMPSEGYADQPYVVKTDDGAWLCVITTGTGHEGEPGQHVVSMRSTDQGRTWSDIVPLEPSDGPESAYAVLLKVPTGRVYAFYNHNTDNVREVKREDGAFGRGPTRWATTSSSTATTAAGRGRSGGMKCPCASSSATARTYTADRFGCSGMWVVRWSWRTPCCLCCTRSARAGSGASRSRRAVSCGARTSLPRRIPRR